MTKPAHTSVKPAGRVTLDQLLEMFVRDLAQSCAEADYEAFQKISDNHCRRDGGTKDSR